MGSSFLTMVALDANPAYWALFVMHANSWARVGPLLRCSGVDGVVSDQA